MSFNDEIVKLQRTLRCYIRFQTGTGSENPGVSGTFSDRRWGKVADNTGAVPIKGTVAKLGTFTRALTNADQGFETPSVASDILDKDNEWRQMAAQPWTILNRLFYYVLRVRDNVGAHYDADIAWGQLTLPEFDHGKARITVQMIPDYLGKTVPKRLVGVDDWADADPSALGRPVPIIYGKMDNTVGDIEGLTATRIDPSGYVAPVLSGVLASGGNPPYSIGHYYAICALDALGVPASPLSNVIGPFVNDSTNSAVDLSWVAGGPLPPYWQLYRGNSADFGQMDMYREGDWHFPGLIDGTTLAVTDEWTGMSSRDQQEPDTHWDLRYRQQVSYYLSAVAGLEEQVPGAGPAGVYLAPMNGGGAVQITWDPIDASSLILRRFRQAYHFDGGYDRQWTIAPSATSFTDFLDDTSAVTIPDGFGRPRAGALEALYVDTNPAGLAGQYKYLLAGHGCKEVREVYVTKSKVTSSGGSSGSINRPSGLTLTKVGATDTTVYRYTVTATNANGETVDSNQVRRSDGPAALSGSDRNDLEWDDVDGATGYRIYRSGDDEDLSLLGSSATSSFSDDGSLTPDTSTHPPENNTTGTAYASGQETSPPEPILQTKNVDYFVETTTINGNLYQIIRFNAAQEGNPVTVNVWGIETLGTATGNADGGTLITNIVEQFKHFLYNWVFNSYESGAWFTTTGFMAGLINDASFTAASAVAASRIAPSGYVGAGALLDETDVLQTIQDWLTSSDLDWYPWEGQFKVKMFDPAVVDRDALPQYTTKVGVFRESFKPSLDVTRHWNKIGWQAGPQVDGYYISGSEKDDDSIRLYGRTIESPIRTLFWTRSLTTARDIISRTLRLTKNPPIYAGFSVPIGKKNDEIASLIAVTHPEGIDISSQGWNQRACKILRSDIDLDRSVINMTVLDVDTLIALLGYVRYGTRIWSAPDLTYTTALASGKPLIYGYYADRATNKFSNGDGAKKYWSR